MKLLEPGIINPTFTNEFDSLDNKKRWLNNFGTILSKISEDGDKKLNENGTIPSDDILCVSTEIVNKTDFSREIRTTLEINCVLKEIAILLDLSSNDLKNAVYHLIKEIFLNTNQNLENINMESIISTIFIDQKKELIGQRIQENILIDKSENNNNRWLCLLGKHSSINKPLIGIARLQNPIYVSEDLKKIRFLIIIFSNTHDNIRSAYELGKTFSTIFSNIDFRDTFSRTKDICVARDLIRRCTNELKKEQLTKSISTDENEFNDDIIENVSRRIKCYHKDFIDGILGKNTIHKTIATTMFLYFTILLPTIAFSAINYENTNGQLDLKRSLIGQGLGGIIFSLFSGQPLIIIGTTALISLYVKVLYEVCTFLGIEFFTLYLWAGLWNSLFLTIYSFFGWSKFIKYSTRSVEEIFSLFIAICFILDSFSDFMKSVKVYWSSECNALVSVNATNYVNLENPCEREVPLATFILIIGTVWLSLKIYKINESSFFTGKIRELLSDYALPIGVITFSIIGSWIFKDIKVERFTFPENFSLEAADFSKNISWSLIGISCVLGFALSLIFFLDQNITGKIVNSSQYNLKKGSAPHLDLFMLGVVNGLLSVYGLPWMHGMLPHSPLHIFCLSDTKEITVHGLTKRVITKVRETRLTSLLASILVGLSLYFIPYPLFYIPVPVLDGLFLYCAIASLRGNSLIERICLIITEKILYPPTHYIRKCPEKKIFIFTLIEVLQFILLCFVGFAPWIYLRLAFPIFLAFLIPLRHLVVPLIIGNNILKEIDCFE